MERRLLSEVGRVRRDPLEGASERRVVDAERLPLPRERIRVRLLLRPKAREAAAAVQRAERAATGLRHRPEARNTAADHDAGRARPLAVDTDAVAWDVRPPAGECRPDDLEQLAFVDRAALQLEV